MLAKVADLQQEQREEQLLLQQQQEKEEEEEEGPKIHTGFKSAYVSVNRTLSAVVWSATDGRLEVRRFFSVDLFMEKSVCLSVGRQVFVKIVLCYLFVVSLGRCHASAFAFSVGLWVGGLSYPTERLGAVCCCAAAVSKHAVSFFLCFFFVSFFFFTDLPAVGATPEIS